MIVVAAAARLFGVNPDKPYFPAKPGSNIERNLYRVRYNDLRAQVAGFNDTCLALVDRYKDGRVRVCFAPDPASVSFSRACRPYEVADLLATGLYREKLKSTGVQPEKITLHMFTPKVVDHCPDPSENCSEPAALRNIKTQPLPDGFADISDTAPTGRFFYFGAPRVFKNLMAQANKGLPELDLTAYTPWRPRQLQNS